MVTRPPEEPPAAQADVAPDEVPAEPSDDADDDEALAWDRVDDPTLIERRVRAPRTRATPRAVPETETETEAGDATPAVRPVDAPSSALGLVVSGVLVGVYALETLGWLQGVLGRALAATVDPGTGSGVDVLAIVLNVGGRIAAVLAPAVWLTVALAGFTGRRRLAWTLLGAVVLVPWPALVHG